MYFRTSNDECCNIYCIILLLDETLTCPYCFPTVFKSMNMATDYHAISLAGSIKKYFEINPNTMEVLVFKGNMERIRLS